MFEGVFVGEAEYVCAVFGQCAVCRRRRGTGCFNTEAQRHRGTEGMTAADLPIVSCTSHIAISDVGGVCGGDGG
jgi:hypothetical protein